MWLKMLGQICCDLIFIGIDHICLRMFLQCSCDLIQSIGCKQIIMIQKCDKISSCHGKGCIGILSDTEIFLQIFIADPFIHLCIGSQYKLHIRIFRTAICETEFPVLICLGKQRIKHLS